MKRIVSALLIAVFILPMLMMLVPVTDIYAFDIDMPATYINGPKAGTKEAAVTWAKSKIGKALDYDNEYGAQCVDLIYFYYRYLGEASPGGNARDFINRSVPSGWQKITYKSGVKLQAGDIVVWKVNYRDSYSGITSHAQYGHISIVLTPEDGTFVTLHQNAKGYQYCITDRVGNDVVQCIFRPNFAKAGTEPVLTWSESNKYSVSSTNAILAYQANLNTCAASEVTNVACYLYDVNDNLLEKVKQSVTTAQVGIYRYVTPFFNVNTELGYTLQAGTTYKYKVSVIIDGAEYFSPVKTFKTTGPASTQKERYNSVTVSGKTCNDARIEAQIPLTYISEAGFYLGTSQRDMKQHVEKLKAQNVSWIAYNISESGLDIKPDTTYYYQFYYVCNGTVYKSDVRTLKTEPCEHKTGEWIIDKEATSVREGMKTFTCAICGQTKTEIIPKLASTGKSPFTDVPATEWYTQTILAVYEKGLMIGDSLTTFNPEGKMTVAEALTIASRVHSLNTTGKELNVLGGANWYDGYVNYAIVNGIIKYNDFDNYDRNATRAEMAYVFSRCVGTDKLAVIKPNSSAPDVSHDHRFANEITALYKAGVVQGSDEIGRYYPERDITRAEVATIVARLTNIVDRIR